jgi:flagellar protein FlaF
MSIAAYRRRNEVAETPRELERRAFTTVISKLIEGKKQGGRELVAACYLNSHLWSTLMLDLALPENALPPDVKAQLISIAIWVQRYTPQVMRGAASPDPLISVNRNIVDGLSTSPAPASGAPQKAEAEFGVA